MIHHRQTWKEAQSLGTIGSAWLPLWPLQGYRRHQYLMGDVQRVLTFETGNPAGELLLGNYLEADPQSAGAGENLLLPPVSVKRRGVYLKILNIGGEIIFLQDSAGAAIVDINPNGMVFCYCTGTAWLVSTLEGGQAPNLAPTIPQIVRVTAAALTGDVDVILKKKMRVIDAWCVHTAGAGAGDTIQIKETANAITDAMDLNVADEAVVRAGTIDDAEHDIPAGGTLRITGASAVDAEVYVQLIEVP